MTYIYDILLNFHNKLYDFYEWNSSDQILHVKKIPLFNLNSNDYLKIKNNIVKFPKKFTDKLHNSAILYKKRKIINYMFLITDETDIIAIKLNKNGISIKKSTLLPEEADDIILISKNTEKDKIPFEIIKENIKPNFNTRLEQEKKEKIAKTLNTLFKQKDINKLSFLYLECFNKSENNLKKIFCDFKNEIETTTKNYNKIIDFFNLIKKG